MKTLIILSHPDFVNSTANKTIVEYLENHSENIEIRHLEKLYPDFKIDVEAEQEALKKADVVILQHPFYWYSTPAMLKQWLDTVWAWGFAYGTNGDKLKGKHFVQSITVGGPRESYNALGFNQFTMEQLLRPMERTAYMAQMNYHEPIYSFRNFYAPGIWNSISEVQENATVHAQRIVALMERLRIGNSKKTKEFVHKWFKHFDMLDENGFFVQYLAKDVKMKFPDSDWFTGHDEFHKWYNATKNRLLGNTVHEVTNLKVSESVTDSFDVQMNVRLKAKNKDNTAIDLEVAEAWKLTWDTTADRPIISEYLVEQQ